MLASMPDHVVQEREPLGAESASMCRSGAHAVIPLFVPPETELTREVSRAVRALQLATLRTSSHSLTRRSSFMLSMVVLVEKGTRTD